MLPLITAALVATSCAADSQEESEAQEQAVDTGLLVLTSTDVYSSLVEEVVEGTAEVEAIVESTAVDPHSYEATPQDRLSVEQADVLIANGGGYDPYITQLAQAAEKQDAVFQLISGENWHSHEFDGTYENEHIWYDLSQMSEFVTDFAEHLGELEPANAQLYADNAEALADQIDQLDQRNRSLEAEGLTYLATEAVSGFLLDDAGFENLTELEFLSAVEHGDDAAPRLFFSAIDMIGDGEVDLLSYNEQTETNQSQQIRQEAQDQSVQVLQFTETLPEGTESYLEWMEQNIEQIEQAEATIAQQDD